jgi:hypothetical protein
VPPKYEFLRAEVRAELGITLPSERWSGRRIMGFARLTDLADD